MGVYSMFSVLACMQCASLEEKSQEELIEVFVGVIKTITQTSLEIHDLVKCVVRVGVSKYECYLWNYAQLM